MCESIYTLIWRYAYTVQAILWIEKHLKLWFLRSTNIETSVQLFNTEHISKYQIIIYSFNKIQKIVSVAEYSHASWWGYINFENVPKTIHTIQGFIQPQKSGTHYFLVLIALCSGPYRTISEESGTHNEYQKSPE